jgi:hypothetical protein
MKSLFHNWWFSLAVAIIGLTMFIRYLVPAQRYDMYFQFAGELVIWFAITITFLIRFILQIIIARSPKI